MSNPCPTPEAERNPELLPKWIPSEHPWAKGISLGGPTARESCDRCGATSGWLRADEAEAWGNAHWPNTAR